MLRQLAISLAFAVAVLPATARTRPHYGGTLRVEVAGDAWQQDGLARRLVFDGLTDTAPDGTTRPALATSWTSENAEHRWQFRLRPGVYFHDGSALTSTAVVASLLASCGSNCPWTAVHALGTSIVFTSDAPMVALPALLACDRFLIVNPHASAPDGGTGPFHTAGVANATLTLAENNSYWGGRPFLDSIEIRGHRAVADQWMDLTLGRADLVEVPAERMREAQQQHLTVAASAPIETLVLQVAASGALANPKLRAAIAQAIDRSALANVIFQRQARPIAALLPQSVSGYAFLFPAERDLKKAQELRGGITPPPLFLEGGGSSAMQVAAQRLMLNLREAGFNVQIAPVGRHPDLALRVFTAHTGDAAAELAHIAWASGEPAPTLGASDEGSVYKAEREMLERHTLIPLLNLPRVYAVGSSVRDVRLSFDGMPDLASVSMVPAAGAAP